MLAASAEGPPSRPSDSSHHPMGCCHVGNIFHLCGDYSYSDHLITSPKPSSLFWYLFTCNY